MNRLLLVAVLLLGIVGAQAQSDLLLMGVGVAPKTSGPVAYSGPGNIASGAIAFYGCGRAYNLAYAQAQSAACDLVDTATGLATCTLSFGTNGFADLVTRSCVGGTVTVVTFCTVTHVGCSVAKMYDQTGNGNDVVQATLASMPGLTFSAQNGLPCVAGTTTGFLKSSGTISQVAPYTFVAVVERTGNFTTGARIMSATSNLQFLNSANTVAAQSGAAVSLTAADSAFHALLAVFSTTNPLFAVDSSANTSTSANTPGSIAAAATLMATNGGTTVLKIGLECEAGIWPADLNSSYQAMLANMRSATNGWNF